MSNQKKGRRWAAYVITQQIFREIITTGHMVTHGTVVVEEGLPEDARFVGFAFRRHDGVVPELSTDDATLILAIFEHPSFPEIEAGVEIPSTAVIMRRLPIDVPGPATEMIIDEKGLAHFLKPSLKQNTPLLPVYITLCNQMITTGSHTTLRDIWTPDRICPDCWPWRTNETS